MAYTGFDSKTLDERVTLTLTKRDWLLIRLGLEELLQTYTRHEHLDPDIRATLDRIPVREAMMSATR